MALITDSDVQGVIQTDLDTTPFITIADLIVTEDLASLGHSSDRLKQIELYIAAHFVAISDREGGLTSLKLGDVTEQYGKLAGEFYMMTRYGQMALALESTGTLKGLSGQTARFKMVATISDT